MPEMTLFRSAQFSGHLNLHAGAGTRCRLIAEQYWCTIAQITAIQFSFGTSNWGFVEYKIICDPVWQKWPIAFPITQLCESVIS